MKARAAWRATIERARTATVAFTVALVAACAELGTDPAVPVAIEFGGFPYPATIAGDTLRDADGVAVPLAGVAYNGRGDVIADAPFAFFTLDTGVTVSPEGYLVTTRRDGAVRIVASAGGLQSPARRLEVTRSPDAVGAVTATEVRLGYVIPDASSNVSTPLTVRVTSSDVAGGVSPNVAGWLVRWRAIHAGDTLGAGDTTLVAMLGEGTARSMLDTTGTDGQSSRRIRLFANALAAAEDSVIVVAEVRRHGVQLAGSPVRFVITVEPATP